MTKGCQDLKEAFLRLEHSLCRPSSILQFCQQSAEKALKGCIFAHSGFSQSWIISHWLTTLSRYSPFTSNVEIKSLAERLENIGREHSKITSFVSLSVRSRCCSFYNGKLLKETNPEKVFSRDDAEKGYQFAEKIVLLCISILDEEKQRVNSKQIQDS
jgi:HEPN domain-containing protein